MPHISFIEVPFFWSTALSKYGACLSNKLRSSGGKYWSVLPMFLQCNWRSCLSLRIHLSSSIFLFLTPNVSAQWLNRRMGDANWMGFLVAAYACTYCPGEIWACGLVVALLLLHSLSLFFLELSTNGGGLGSTVWSTTNHYRVQQNMPARSTFNLTSYADRYLQLLSITTNSCFLFFSFFYPPPLVKRETLGTSADPSSTFGFNIMPNALHFWSFCVILHIVLLEVHTDLPSPTPLWLRGKMHSHKVVLPPPPLQVLDDQRVVVEMATNKRYFGAPRQAFKAQCSLEDREINEMRLSPFTLTHII